MTRSKARSLLFGTALLAACVLGSCDSGKIQDVAISAAPERDLAMMTSLPLIWGEAGNIETILSGEVKPHLFYKALQRTYNVTALDSLDSGILDRKNPDILLLAQNRPLAPSELVALDDWIRAGGRALILADPLLKMDSRYPLGDKRRPEAVSLMSPLFNRWGLNFTFDDTKDAGLHIMEAGDLRVRTYSIGGFSRISKQDANIAECAPAELKLMARCRIGKGKAILIADADMLDTALLQQSDNSQFLMLLLDELLRD